jgi:integrase
MGERTQGSPLPFQSKGSRLFRRLLTEARAWRLGRGTHVMRHTYGRLGTERYGWSIEMLRIFMGHQSILTTQGYAHLRGAGRYQDGERTHLRVLTPFFGAAGAPFMSSDAPRRATDGP